MANSATQTKVKKIDNNFREITAVQYDSTDNNPVSLPLVPPPIPRLPPTYPSSVPPHIPVLFEGYPNTPDTTKEIVINSIDSSLEKNRDYLMCGFIRSISTYVIMPITTLILKYYYIPHEYFGKTLHRSDDNLTITNFSSNGAQTGYGIITINSKDSIFHEWIFKVKQMRNYAYGIKLGLIEFDSNTVNRQLIHVRENKYCFASNGGDFGQNKVGGPHTEFEENDQLLMTLDLTKKENKDFGVLEYSVFNEELQKYDIKRTYDEIKIGNDTQYKMCVILDGGGFDESDQAITLMDYWQKWIWQ